MEAHKNNVGLLRLTFASFVILGHAPELVDGNRSREPLTVLFHTVSLGELSVDGFFLLSGYLITKSVYNSRSYIEYFSRRFLRIYPAYTAAFLICIFAMAGPVGGETKHHPVDILKKIATLQMPSAQGALSGLHYPALNGAMWTIAYEFHCYIFIAFLSALGILKRRFLFLSFAGLGLAGITAVSFYHVRSLAGLVDEKIHHSYLGIAVVPSIRFTAIFVIGACFFLFRGEIGKRLNGRIALVCTTLLLPLLLFRHSAEAALVTLGAVVCSGLLSRRTLVAFNASMTNGI